jgi:hypothetical protein
VLGNFNTIVKAVTGNDLVHFNAAIDAATLGLVQVQTMMAQTSFAGGMGGGFASRQACAKRRGTVGLAANPPPLITETWFKPFSTDCFCNET